MRKMKGGNMKNNKLIILLGVAAALVVISIGAFSITGNAITGNALWASDYCRSGSSCYAGEGDCDGPRSTQIEAEDGTFWRESTHCKTGWCHLDVGENYGQRRNIDVCECLDGTYWNSRTESCIEMGETENCNAGAVNGQLQDTDGDGCISNVDSDCGGAEAGSFMRDDIAYPTSTGSSSNTQQNSFADQCSDGIDNDCDGMIDMADDDRSCDALATLPVEPMEYATYAGVLRMLNSCEHTGFNLIGSTEINGKVVGDVDLDTCDEICGSKICIDGFLAEEDTDTEKHTLISYIDCDTSISSSSGSEVQCNCCTLNS